MFEISTLFTKLLNVLNSIRVIITKCTQEKMCKSKIFPFLRNPPHGMVANLFIKRLCLSNFCSWERGKLWSRKALWELEARFSDRRSSATLWAQQWVAIIKCGGLLCYPKTLSGSHKTETLTFSLSILFPNFASQISWPFNNLTRKFYCLTYYSIIRTYLNFWVVNR